MGTGNDVWKSTLHQYGREIYGKKWAYSNRSAAKYDVMLDYEMDAKTTDGVWYHSYE